MLQLASLVSNSTGGAAMRMLRQFALLRLSTDLLVVAAANLWREQLRAEHELRRRSGSAMQVRVSLFKGRMHVAIRSLRSRQRCYVMVSELLAGSWAQSHAHRSLDEAPCNTIRPLQAPVVVATKTLMRPNYIAPNGRPKERKPKSNEQAKARAREAGEAGLLLVRRREHSFAL